MKTKTLIIIALVIVVITGLFFLGKYSGNGSAKTGVKQGVLTSDSALFDFGKISMADGKVSHQFKITNSSSDPVKLKKIYTSCMCTSVNFQINEKNYGPFGMEGMSGLTSTNVTLNPGDSAVADVIYDPAAHGPAGVGPIDRFAYLQDANGGQLQMEIKAVVNP